MTTPLARARLNAQKLLTSSIRIVRDVGTSDSAGGKTRAPGIVATYPGRVMSVNEDTELKQGERVTALERMLVKLPWNAQVKTSDRVRLPDNTEVEVIGLNDQNTDRLLLDVQCRRRR